MNYSDADDLRKMQADAAEDAELAEQRSDPDAEPSVPEPTEPCAGLALAGETGESPRYCVKPAGHADECRDLSGSPIIDPAKVSDLSADDSQRCESVPGGGGWAKVGMRCEQPAGHDGPHNSGPVQWGDLSPSPDLPRQPCGDTSDPYGRSCERVAGHPGFHAAGETAKHYDERARADDWPGCPAVGPSPVAARVRILELPHHRGALVAGIMRAPFALVVDMLGTLEHVGAQEAFWTEHGKAMGAVRTIVAAGTIDLDDAQL